MRTQKPLNSREESTGTQLRNMIWPNFFDAKIIGKICEVTGFPASPKEDDVPESAGDLHPIIPDEGSTSKKLLLIEPQPKEYEWPKWWD